MSTKDKLGRIVFRKIGGKIVPIRIKNVVDSRMTQATWSRHRKIVATLPNGDEIGRLGLQIPDKGKAATITDVQVNPNYQKKGISTNLFKRATDFLERSGFRFLRSTDLQHPAQAKIRSKFGKYGPTIQKKSPINPEKTIPVRKNRTKFFADQFGPWNEETRRITKDEAIAILKNNKNGRLITATTMLKKRIKK